MGHHAYSVKMKFSTDGRKKTPVCIEKVLCGIHCHAFPENKKYVNRRIVERERVLIKSGHDQDGSL